MTKVKYLIASFALLLLLISVISISMFAAAGDFSIALSGAVDKEYERGKEYTLKADYEYLPSSPEAQMSFSWYKNGSLISGASGDSLSVSSVSDSGSYCCRIDINDGGVSYYGVSNQISVSIRPRAIDISAIKWDYTAPFTYDGKAHSVKLSGASSELSFSYSSFNSDYEPVGADIASAGKYITTASISYDTANCILTGGALPGALYWEIKKASYDMSNISFTDKTVTENGQLQSIAISGKLPEGVSVSYYYNSRIFEGIKYVGKYSVTAVFSGDSKNYEPIPDMNAALTVKKAVVDSLDDKLGMVYRDENGIKKIIVTSAVPMKEGSYINVEDTTEEYKNYDYSSFASFDETASLAVLYAVTVCRDGVTVGTTGKFKVKILIPEEYRNAKGLMAVYMNGQKPEIVDSVVEGDMLVFETDRLSLYGIVAIETKSTPPLIAYVFVAILVVLLFVIVFGRQSLFTKQPDNADKIEAKDNTNPNEDMPPEEIPCTARTDTEADVDSKVEPENPEPKPITAVALAERAEEKTLENTDSEPLSLDSSVRYRTSFTSRLIQSGDAAQGYYTVLKNYILSYNGIKPRTSWNYETYRKGRLAVARVNIKGKSLIVNLALTPDSFLGSKYRFTDLSADKRYAELPMQLKIKSRRALSYATELIDTLMGSLGIEKGILPEIDYRLPYETNRELAERGLVKIIYVKGKAKQSVSEAKDADITELINSKSQPGASVSREIADILITEGEAEKALTHTKGNARTGKLCCVNIGEISSAFKENEVVTLDALKAQGLVGKRYGRLKILADGVLDKPLVIVADKFSVSAVKMILLAGGSAKQID